MANRIQIRRDLAANWTSNNPILAEGEPAYETDTLKEKRGDGILEWNSLPYKIISPDQRVITSSETLTSADNGITIIYNSATPITITFANFGINKLGIEFYNKGAGTVTHASGTASLTSDDGLDLIQGKVATLFQIGSANEYVFKGELE